MNSLESFDIFCVCHNITQGMMLLLRVLLMGTVPLHRLRSTGLRYIFAIANLLSIGLCIVFSVHFFISLFIDFILNL